MKLLRWIIRDFRAKRIINLWFNLFGYQIEIRALPKAFLETEKRLARLADDGRYSQFKTDLEAAYRQYGCDRDLVRLETFVSFEQGDDDETHHNQ